jgi:hypothetical protein
MPAVIFSGNSVKALKTALSLGDNATLSSSAVDPSSVATVGAAGDALFSTSANAVYIKQDSGSSTNWSKSLLTDGTHFNYNSSTHTLTVNNLTVNGTSTNIQTTNVNVSDKLVILNKGGAAASGSNVGFEVEENSIITGYVQTSADRNSWTIQAPNTAGVTTITPGSAGFNFSGTANGVSTSGSLEIDNRLISEVALTVKGSPANTFVPPTGLLWDGEYTNGTVLNATYVSTGSGVPTSTFGSPTVTSNQLDLTANTGQFVTYPATAVAGATQTGTIRFRYTPNYTGTPPETDIMSISDSSPFTGSTPNAIYVYSTGNLHFQLNDISGNPVFDISYPYSPVSGVMDEFELDWDITNGITKLFRNGVVVATNGAVSTRASTGLTDFVVGAFIGGDHANYKITDIVIYNNVQHSSNFSSPVPPLNAGGGVTQTADLQQWKDSTNAILSSVDNLGNMKFDATGTGLQIKSGSNARMGTAVLTGATPVVISNTTVTANTYVFMSIQSVGGTVTTPSFVTALSPGVSFSIAAGAADTSTVAWLLIEAL